MSVIQSLDALRDAASLVHLDVCEMVPVEGRSNLLRLDFRTREELLTDERLNLLRLYNKTDERENGVIIEWDYYLEFLCIFSPLRPEPNQTLVAIILPDLTGLIDRVLALSKEKVDKIAHEPTNAPKSIEPYPQSPTRSQIVGKPMSKENTVVSPERQEIHES
ncbi:hypothetical protein PV11_00024 [Exophiala sideris]|uniref:Uncharacterized protein n=1 Tax=Exophiala sideris TaxID=1016849 RepID=A0A0D1ZBU4_9EURO|nr:hypothetical protein PV11_00024 [Exophiala sideris]